MIFEGPLLKMFTSAETDEASIHPQYTLKSNGQEVHMNELIGKTIRLHYKNQINCVKCGAITKKSFSQGFCYPCFASAPETEECVLRPELCRAHEGIARDMEYAKKHCLKDHFVYLAVSSTVKVGVTRESQIPTRWIDQGASYAIKLAQTPNRHTAGLIEVALKEFMTDKTNWRHMLTNKVNHEIDLLDEKEKIAELLPMDLAEFICDDDTVYDFNYPVSEYPDKVKTINLDKTPQFELKLLGIKGQYLLFENNFVFNVRKFGGYQVKIELAG